MIPNTPLLQRSDAWAYKMRSPADPLVDYERGGVAVGNVSEGLRGYSWAARYDEPTSQVLLYREDKGEDSAVVLVTRPNITRLALSFDQNMRPVLAWVDSTGCFLWYFMPSSSGFGQVQIPGAGYPCVTLDERRPELISDSDVLLAYTRDGNLYCRAQREAYNVEHLLYSGVPSPDLLAFGMSKQLRLQWRLTN